MQSFTLYYPEKYSKVPPLPLFSCKVSAGFPSPANDYEQNPLNLHEYVVDNESTTYFVKAEGDSMTGAGIFDGRINLSAALLIARLGKENQTKLENTFPRKKHRRGWENNPQLYSKFY